MFLLIESILAKISAQILNGLVYLHEEKCIVHRDLKPPNSKYSLLLYNFVFLVLLNSEGVAKIADFGMAGQREGRMRLNWDTFQGTYAYMSVSSFNT